MGVCRGCGAYTQPRNGKGEVCRSVMGSSCRDRGERRPVDRGPREHRQQPVAVVAVDARRLADVGLERDDAAAQSAAAGGTANPGIEHDRLEHLADHVAQRVEVGRFAGAVRHGPPDRRQVLEELLLGVADQTGRLHLVGVL